MSSGWWFSTVGDVVYLQGRAESTDGDTVGHTVQELRAGEHFSGLSFAELQAAGDGKLEFAADGRAHIRKANK